MFVIKIVTGNSSNDMQDDIDAGQAENNKSDHCLNIHFPVQHPEKSKTECRPIPCRAKFFISRFGELKKVLYVVVRIVSYKCPNFVFGGAIGVYPVGRVEIQLRTTVSAFTNSILYCFFAIWAYHFKVPLVIVNAIWNFSQKKFAANLSSQPGPTLY
jgi:hypothetical protein